MEQRTLDFLKSFSLATLATCKDGVPHGVPIYYIYNEEKEVFYFVTKNETRKIDNLKANNKAFLSVVRETPPAVFTGECEASFLNCSEEDCTDVMNKLIEVHSSRDYYPTPLHSLQEGNLVLVELKLVNHEFKSFSGNK